MKKILQLFLIILGTKSFGQQKIFDYAYTNKKGICVYSVTKKKECPLFISGRNPCISPDGKKLAYTAFTKQGLRFITVIDLNTKKKITLNTHSTNYNGSVWSPDGKFIAYNVFNDKKNEWSVAVIDTNGSNPIIIAGKTKSIYSPTWIESGKKLVFHDMSDVFISDLTGNIIQNIEVKKLKMAFGTGSADEFIITDDNKKMVFNAEVNEGDGTEDPPIAIFIYDIATESITRLSPKGYNAGHFIVKNRSILFAGSKDGMSVSNIYSINLNGTNFKMLFAGCQDISAKD